METNLLIETSKDYPLCEHGPTILFRKLNENTKEISDEYFACSACRDRKICSFYLKKCDYNRNDYVNQVSVPELIKCRKELVSEIYLYFHKIDKI